MSVPVLTFFNNKGGVSKTSLVFHLAWMFAEMGKRVVAIDLDPQANLTSAFLDEDVLEALWDGGGARQSGGTIYGCIQPLTKVGDILAPATQTIRPGLPWCRETWPWPDLRTNCLGPGPTPWARTKTSSIGLFAC